MTPVTVAPKGMGLNDFVAMEEGLFAAEGLDVTFDWKTLRGTMEQVRRWGLDDFLKERRFEVLVFAAG